MIEEAQRENLIGEMNKVWKRGSRWMVRNYDVGYDVGSSRLQPLQ